MTSHVNVGKRVCLFFLNKPVLLVLFLRDKHRSYHWYTVTIICLERLYFHKRTTQVSSEEQFQIRAS